MNHNRKEGKSYKFWCPHLKQKLLLRSVSCLCENQSTQSVTLCRLIMRTLF